jgi:hypothetical protein
MQNIIYNFSNLIFIYQNIKLDLENNWFYLHIKIT